MHGDGALRTIYHFNNPSRRSEVVYWPTEAKPEHPLQDRKTCCRNVCAAVSRLRPVLILKGTVSAECLLVGTRLASGLWRFGGALAVTEAGVGESPSETRRHGRSGLPPV